MTETTYVLPFRYSQSIADNLEIIRMYLDEQPGRRSASLSETIRYAITMAALEITSEKLAKAA